MKQNLAPKFNRRQESVLLRKELSTLYYEKYFSLWMNSLEWEGVTDEQKRFIMKEFWNRGNVACFKLEGSEGSELYPNGAPVFAPYAPFQWNIYYTPITVNLINLKAVPFIPKGTQEVNKDVVLGWCHRSHKPMVTLIKPLIDRLIDTEMVIRMNLKAQKMPWLIAVTPETEQKMRELANALESDDPALFVQLGDADKAQSLLSGAPFILDKLYNYKHTIESEIREMLGMGNLGVGEKKEHLITTEIETNDEVTQASRDCYLDEIKEFTERISQYLGMAISVKPKEIERPKQPEQGDDKEDEEDENDDE